MELQDFRQDLLNHANTRAAIDGTFTADAFMAEAADRLVDAGELDNLDLLSFVGTGRRRQGLAVHGFHHDEQDKSVSLAVLRYVGGTKAPSLNFTDAAASLKTLENYLTESLSGEFLVDREPSTSEYQLAQSLRGIQQRKGDDAVSRYRLYLLTDAVLSARAKSFSSEDIDGAPVELHVWDIQRFMQVHESAQGREPLELKMEDWGIGGVPALRVADSAGDVTTYLAALPGQLLADLYRKHGSRLLEGNVRSFLTVRGKINRGIRDTVQNDPGHFLAYNNGISATAASVEFDGSGIRAITDLQIVNGGQTTASLFYATQGARHMPLDDVFVQMKLVVVSPLEATDMVPLISRYANSQNAVREDDFFSNSPFHVRMEELSKKLLAPVATGVNFQTKWYYERTRGQYLNERNRRTPAEQKKFEAEFPRAQVITKTDAAKFTVTWEQQPHQVSGGAQRNFKAFATLVADRYSTQPQAFNENYYRRLVGKAILYNSVRSAISKAEWYEPGYLANLTTYAVAKLSLEISKNSRAEGFDLLRIWDKQAVGTATLDEAVSIARIALEVLTGEDRLVVNVTEWAKRESAWKRLANTPFTLSDAFVLECIPVKLNATGAAALTVAKRFPSEVSDRRHAERVGEGGWRSLQQFLASHSMLNSSDSRLIREVVPSSRKLLDDSVARSLLQLYVKAVNRGWDES